MVTSLFVFCETSSEVNFKSCFTDGLLSISLNMPAISYYVHLHIN